MKWLVLAAALASVFPLAQWMRRYPSQAPMVWLFMGMMPFALSATGFSIAIVSWEEWPGFVKGFQVSALDLIALAVYLGLPRSSRPLPFRLSMAFYFLAVLLSALQAQEPGATLSYAWQLARMFFIYAVVTKSCNDERFVPALLIGMAIGLCFEACIVIWQKFALGVPQPAGTFGHQNLLGLLSHLVTLPFFALLLGGYPGFLAVAVPVAGAVIAALTASRAAAGLTGLGFFMLFILSALRGWTPRKTLVALGVAVTIAVLVPLALPALEKRFAEVEIIDYDERVAFKSAYAAIIADYPMGIGANNSSFFSIIEGYSRRARVSTVDLASSAHVHNAYYLAAAETGYLGLVAFVLLLLRPLMVAFHCGWQHQEDRRGELLLGLGTALFVVYIHSYFEWIFFWNQVQYIFAMNVGIIAGLAQQLGYWRRSDVRGKRRSRLLNARGRSS